jgi:predicted esterase
MNQSRLPWTAVVVATWLGLAPDARVADGAETLPLPPLTNVGWLEPLSLPDGNLAYVTPPVGAREPRPVVVAVHGAGDRAEWACGGWRIATGNYAFVVCPQGLKMDGTRFAWDSPSTIARRVEASLAALHARFGEYVATGPAIYAGFSQGATLAGPALLQVKDRFAAVVLAEGGYDLMRNPDFLRRLRANGTSRALVVCGSPNCFRSAPGFERTLTMTGFETAVAGDPLSGHNLNQRMQEALRAAWPPFFQPMEGWRGFVGIPLKSP